MKNAKVLKHHEQFGSQTGATLVITMAVLLVISIVAIMAFRQSDNDLSVSTSAQVRNVLFQSSDMGLAVLEKESREGNLNKENGLIPYLQSVGTSNDRVGNELTFCMRPRQAEIFDRTKISEKSVFGGHIVKLPRGYCNPNQTGSTGDYTSARETTILQMTVEKIKLDSNCGAFCRHNWLTKLGYNQKDFENRIEAVAFKATSTAILPAFTGASSTDVYTCMQKMARFGTSGKSTEECLKTKNVPQKITEQGYIYRYIKPIEKGTSNRITALGLGANG